MKSNYNHNVIVASYNLKNKNKNICFGDPKLNPKIPISNTQGILPPCQKYICNNILRLSYNDLGLHLQQNLKHT